MAESTSFQDGADTPSPVKFGKSLSANSSTVKKFECPHCSSSFPK